MKKFLITFVVIVFMNTTAFAGSAIKNYYGYTIKNKRYTEIENQVVGLSNGNEVVLHPVKGFNHAYYFEWNNEHYYMRFYPANKNADIFVVADVPYDKNDNDLVNAMKKHSYNYVKLEDKQALKEYQFDFVDVIHSGALNGFIAMPDLIKPLKTGMSKLNDKMSKGNKKTSVIPYSEDYDTIDLTCIDTLSYKDDAAQISIVSKEYRLKNKQNKYVHAFEYVLKNEGDTDLLVKKVSSERLAALKDVTTQTFVDLDRLDLVDTVASFPPVVVCTAGTSLLLSVPNWVRLAKITKESTRYSHSLPENYTLKAHKSMRILVLKFKNDPKPLNFDLVREGQTFNVSF